MRPASMTGVGDAGLLYACTNAGFSTSKTSTSCTMRPVARSRHRANSFLASGCAVVTQTWLSQTTGEDQPLPGIAAFQRTFSVSLQVIGRPVASAWPSACGPRNAGQLPAIATAGDIKRTATIQRDIAKLS